MQLVKTERDTLLRPLQIGEWYCRASAHIADSGQYAHPQGRARRCLSCRPTSKCRSPRTPTSVGASRTARPRWRPASCSTSCAPCRIRRSDALPVQQAPDRAIGQVPLRPADAGRRRIPDGRASRALQRGQVNLPQKTPEAPVARHGVTSPMAQQDIRYYLNGLLLVVEGKNVMAVATDGHRLAFLRGRDRGQDFPRQEVIIPRKTIIELQRLLEDSDDEGPAADRQQTQVKLTFGRHRADLQAGRRQVPRLHPRGARRATRTASPSAATSCCARCNAPRS